MRQQYKFIINAIIISVILLLILSSLYFYIFYKDYFVRAYFSTKADCFQVPDEPNISPGYSVAGIVEKINGTTTITMYVDEESPIYNMVLNHENCHVRQIEKEGIFYSCYLLPVIYLNELSCYSRYGLP